MSDRKLGHASVDSARRVLIVEDDDNVRATLQELLLAEGYECIDAEDGIEALEWLAQVPVDLVVADILMPRMGGPELIMRIREKKTWAGIGILLLSGYADLTRYRGLPVDAVQLKPFALEDFLKKVREIIGPAREGSARAPSVPSVAPPRYPGPE